MLTGKNVIITGAGGLLGRAIAACMEREGAHLALMDRSADALEGIPVRPDHCRLRGDVTREADIALCLAGAMEALGEIDVLVNCHGLVTNTLLLDMTRDEWERTFDVNVLGTMLVIQAMARNWTQAKRPGVIVNLSSLAAKSARAGGSHYCASKSAISMMTEVWAIELGRAGIRVNAVAPGLVMEQVADTVEPGMNAYVALSLDATPLGRTGAPNDVAEAVTFLASDRAAWITGSVLEVTGGAHCGRSHMPASGVIR